MNILFVLSVFLAGVLSFFLFALCFSAFASLYGNFAG